MKKHDIVVIGASAGGVEALRRLVAEIPPDLPAAIFVVIHMPPWYESKLPKIIGGNGRAVAVPAQPEQPIEHGRIYVAPPDYHMLVDDGHVRLWRGPKENLHRPSVNALFRSAAVTYGGRVAGIVLSGALDDGSAGLWWIKRYDGMAIVQDPRDATFPDMPQNAMQYVEVDYVMTADEIGRSLVRIVNGVEIEGSHER